MLQLACTLLASLEVYAYDPKRRFLFPIMETQGEINVGNVYSCINGWTECFWAAT